MKNVDPESVMNCCGCSCCKLTIGQSNAFVIHPEKPDGRWLCYAPTFIGSYPADIHTWLFERILSNGIAIAGIDVGESYGNKAGREIFSRFHSYLTENYQLQPKAILLAQSRGALMLYNWAAENPSLVDRIAGIYPVCDLRSYPGIEIAAAAYEMTVEEMENDIEKNNPVDRLDSLVSNKVRIFHVHGDSDEIVPLEQNSARLIGRYNDLGGDAKLVIIPGAGHEEIEQFFCCEDLLNFITE